MHYDPREGGEGGGRGSVREKESGLWEKRWGIRAKGRRREVVWGRGGGRKGRGSVDE